MVFKIKKICVVCSSVFMGHPNANRKTCGYNCSNALAQYRLKSGAMKKYRSDYGRKPEVILRKKKFRDQPKIKERERLKRMEPTRRKRNLLYQQNRRYNIKIDQALALKRKELNNRVLVH